MQTEQLTTVNILSLFETNKAERISFKNDVISRIKSGEVDPIKVHAQVKKMEEIVKALNDDKTYKSYLLDAAEKMGKKFNAYDAEWVIKEVGVKYIYDMCGDPEIVAMQRTIDELNEKIKARQKFLQTLPGEGMDVVTKDGELIKVYPPSKTSTTSVAVTLK
jgi:hypothetical protein